MKIININTGATLGQNYIGDYKVIMAQDLRGPEEADLSWFVKWCMSISDLFFDQVHPELVLLLTLY